MTKQTITIPIDAKTARAYKFAPAHQRRKIQALVSLWLRQLVSGGYPSLQEVLDDAGRKAVARGLRPEILEKLLERA